MLRILLVGPGIEREGREVIDSRFQDKPIYHGRFRLAEELLSRLGRDISDLDKQRNRRCCYSTTFTKRIPFYEGSVRARQKKITTNENLPKEEKY